MKKYLLFTLLLLSGIIVAQEKTSYLTVSGNIGSSLIKYDLHGGERNSKMGYGFQVGYSYFFDQNWGISTGIGLSHYKTSGKLKGDILPDEGTSLGMQVDDDDISGKPKDYELRYRLGHLKEDQSSFMLEIPIMGQYQTRFGEDKRWGAYGGLGIKIQIPVNAKFKVKEGRLNVSGYYPHSKIDKGAPGLPPVDQHGFGTIEDVSKTLKWKDDIDLKVGIAGSAELGGMVDLGNDFDLMLGAYIDYGFNDIRKHKNDPLIKAPASYIPTANGQVGKGLIYEGLINTDQTGKVKLLSFGVKLALRFKL